MLEPLLQPSLTGDPLRQEFGFWINLSHYRENVEPNYVEKKLMSMLAEINVRGLLLKSRITKVVKFHPTRLWQDYLKAVIKQTKGLILERAKFAHVPLSPLVRDLLPNLLKFIPYMANTKLYEKVLGIQPNEVRNNIKTKGFPRLPYYVLREACIEASGTGLQGFSDLGLAIIEQLKKWMAGPKQPFSPNGTALNMVFELFKPRVNNLIPDIIFGIPSTPEEMLILFEHAILTVGPIEAICKFHGPKVLNGFEMTTYGSGDGAGLPSSIKFSSFNFFKGLTQSMGTHGTLKKWYDKGKVLYTTCRYDGPKIINGSILNNLKSNSYDLLRRLWGDLITPGIGINNYDKLKIMDNCSRMEVINNLVDLAATPTPTDKNMWRLTFPGIGLMGLFKQINGLYPNNPDYAKFALKVIN